MSFFFKNPFKSSKPKEDDIPPHSTSPPKVLSPLEPLKFAKIPEPLDPESLVSAPSGDLVTQLCEEHKSKIPAVEAPHKSLPRKEEFISKMKQKYKECKKYIHEVNQKSSEEEQRINQLMEEHNKNIDPTKYEELKTRAEQLKKELKDFETKYNDLASAPQPPSPAETLSYYKEWQELASTIEASLSKCISTLLAPDPRCSINGSPMPVQSNGFEIEDLFKAINKHAEGMHKLAKEVHASAQDSVGYFTKLIDEFWQTLEAKISSVKEKDKSNNWRQMLESLGFIDEYMQTDVFDNLISLLEKAKVHQDLLRIQFPEANFSDRNGGGNSVAESTMEEEKKDFKNIKEQQHFFKHIKKSIKLLKKYLEKENSNRPKEEANDPNSIYNKNKKRINKADFQIKFIQSHFLNENGQVDPHGTQSQVKDSTKSNGKHPDYQPPVLQEIECAFTALIKLLSPEETDTEHANKTLQELKRCKAQCQHLQSCNFDDVLSKIQQLKQDFQKQVRNQMKLLKKGIKDAGNKEKQGGTKLVCDTVRSEIEMLRARLQKKIPEINNPMKAGKMSQISPETGQNGFGHNSDPRNSKGIPVEGMNSLISKTQEVVACSAKIPFEIAKLQDKIKEKVTKLQSNESHYIKTLASIQSDLVDTKVSAKLLKSKISQRMQSTKTLEQSTAALSLKMHNCTLDSLKLQKPLLDSKIASLIAEIKSYNSKIDLDLLKQNSELKPKTQAFNQAYDYYQEQKKKLQNMDTKFQQDKNRIAELTKAEHNYKGCIIKARQNDITDEPVDAIVNPANEHLTNGAGAAKAIEDGAGAEYRKECDQYLQRHGTLLTGQAMVTTGGDLPCDYVINVVGPQCEEEQENISNESKKLKRVLKNILNKTVESDFKIVSIPAVSTGLFNFPLKE